MDASGIHANKKMRMSSVTPVGPLSAAAAPRPSANPETVLSYGPEMSKPFTTSLFNCDHELIYFGDTKIHEDGVMSASGHGYALWPNHMLKYQGQFVAGLPEGKE